VEASVKATGEAHTAHVIVNRQNLARVFEKAFGKGAEDKHIRTLCCSCHRRSRFTCEGPVGGDGYVNLERKGARAGYATNIRSARRADQDSAPEAGDHSFRVKEKGSVMENISHSEAYRIHFGDINSLKSSAPSSEWSAR
jgi:hypothetical protein